MKNVKRFVNKIIKSLDDAEINGGGDIVDVDLGNLDLRVSIHVYTYTGEPKHVYLESVDVIKFIKENAPDEYRDLRTELRKSIHQEIDAMMGDI
ncbi:hypothetical protein VPHD181_0035 [Vibrio phage D181]